VTTAEAVTSVSRKSGVGNSWRGRSMTGILVGIVAA
jgi:hypothetical protein